MDIAVLMENFHSCGLLVRQQILLWNITIFNRGHLPDYGLTITLVFQTVCQISATKNCYRPRKKMSLC